ncbi:MAG TPA: zinc-dependent metalloprotease [Nocardioidaceae bacterium]|nr:zinc-dependent metalloprotease [Nocardioidaceae bacterium]
MADVPISGPADDGEQDPAHDPQNPFAGSPFEELLGGLASGDPASLQAVFGQIQRMFAPHEGAVNWEFARDLARQTVAQSNDPAANAGDAARVSDAARLAEHWLDQATEFPAPSSTVAAWSRAEWVEASMPTWRRLVEPVAESVVKATSAAIPAEAQAMAGPMMGLLNQLGSAMFTSQIGQAIGGLSEEVVSATDIGFPVGDVGKPAIVFANAEAFGEGLDISADDVLLYLVLRECAHQRLYAHAPWLRDHLFSAIEDYGRGITIDTSQIEESMRGLDPSNPAALQEAMTSGGLFDLEHTPAQQAALTRLETALALVEGWVDEVVGQATEKAMPQAGALRETVRRRRASGGPAEATFATLVGLELRPRRLRDAATLWGALRAAEGATARDAVWAHPESLPTAADLDDPLAFAQRTRAADDVDISSPEFDAALAALLDEGTTAGGPAGRDEPDDESDASAGDDSPGPSTS